MIADTAIYNYILRMYQHPFAITCTASFVPPHRRQLESLNPRRESQRSTSLCKVIVLLRLSPTRCVCEILHNIVLLNSGQVIILNILNLYSVHSPSIV